MDSLKRITICLSDIQGRFSTAIYYRIALNEYYNGFGTLIINDKEIERVRRRLKSNIDETKTAWQCSTYKDGDNGSVDCL